MEQFTTYINYNNIIIGTNVISLIILTIITYKYTKLKKVYKTCKSIKKSFRKKEDIEIFKENKKILDEHLMLKFHHYFSTNILPLYKFGKKVEKKIITKTKEDFYSDSMKTMPDDLKDYFQEIYGKTEFDVLLLQYYFINLNKFDAKNSNTKNDYNEKEYQDILNFAKPE